MNKYNESGFAPTLEPGSYIIRLQKIETTNKDGAPLKDKDGLSYENFVFTVAETSNKLWEKFYLDPSGPYADARLGKFKQFLMAIGAELSGGETEHLIGETCRANVTVREYNGKTFNNIIAFEPKNPNDNFPITKQEDDDKDLPF
ncbi:MAG: hypothetical protein WC356_06780 [Candidatus Micrarchaeia archaeon]|jgi:hypothetical protein